MDAHVEILIVTARERSLAEINSLIASSKSYWTWPADYLEAALPLHILTIDDLRRNHCFEVLAPHGRLIAFYSVAADAPRVVLDNFWVAPDLIGRGVGRKMCEHLFGFSREQGWTDLWVLPDPPAEGFYRRVGFTDTGERTPSRVPHEPVFSVYRLRLQPGPEETGDGASPPAQ
jgi:GNAT superfamily N-acetyltransferase